MPTLKQLIDDLSWNDLLDTLTVRTNGPRAYLYFENILKQLRFLDPRPSNMRILALYTPNESGDYIHTCALNGEIDPDTGDEQHWDISFNRWEEWLGMEIDPTSLENFGAAELVAACIHGMSWDGRSQTIIRNKARKIGSQPRARVFISHAGEDKDAVARPLAMELQKPGLDVWFDEFDLRVGDNLRERIAEGISNADYGIVILSKDFFRKKWPERELSGLVALELARERRLMPIWHGVTATEVMTFDPSLANKVALSTTNLSIEAIALKIEEAIYIESQAKQQQDEEEEEEE